MKVRSEVDLWIQLIFGSVLIVMIASSFLIPFEDRWMMFIVIIPMIIFLLWMLLNTWYELREDYLYCVSGPFRERIYYDKIKSIKLTENMLSSMALSRKRIEIRQYDKNYFSGTTMISPVNRAEFFAQLKQRCKHLQK